MQRSEPTEREQWRRARLAWAVTGFAALSVWCGPIGTTGSNPRAPDAGSGASSSGGGADAGGGFVPPAGDAGHGPTADAGTGSTPTTEAGSSETGLHVEGNHFVDSGKTVRLLGVDHSGSEYSCINTSTAIFEGPTDASLVTPMKAWNVNTVRVPLNEDCWLGINGVAAAVSGAAYQQAITSFVQMLRQNGMYVIVDLHWNAPGTTLATSQQPMPDADHAEDFWISVANAFKSDVGVVFDLYNEPYPEKGTSDPGGCLLNGCSLSNWTGFSGAANAVGMQQLVTDIRTKAGAPNVLLIGGWEYANAIGSWLQYAPNDALGNVAASFHNYNYTACNSPLCWTNDVQPVAAKVPVVTGELGENDCGESYVDSYFAWADPLGISYLGWAWNVQSCNSFPALITSYAGAPTAFGQAFLTHLPTQ